MPLGNVPVLQYMMHRSFFLMGAAWLRWQLPGVMRKRRSRRKVRGAVLCPQWQVPVAGVGGGLDRDTIASSIPPICSVCSLHLCVVDVILVDEFPSSTTITSSLPMLNFHP